MFEIVSTAVLIAHILAVMVAVGAVTITDYIHILGLRSHRFEKQSAFLFPLLSKLIITCLVAIYGTGALLVWFNPSILENATFWLKLFLVLVVTINGYILHHLLWPKIKRSMMTGVYPERLLKPAALAGSVSVVTWYAIVILALTKTTGYSALHFFFVYLLALAVAYMTALYVESHMKRKSGH